MDYDLKGMAALVTGASRGIGQAVARVLAREGAAVGLGGRDLQALEELASTIRASGCRAEPLALDLREAGDGKLLWQRACGVLGAEPALVVICHATLTPMAKAISLDPGDTRAALGSDLEATLGLLGEAAASMMSGMFGRIVLVGSASAQLGQGKAPLYCALKGALEGLCRNLAIDLGRYGVTANLVAPGPVDTERLRRRSSEEMRGRLAQASSLGRLGRPEEVAEVVGFLCSRAASLVTGAVIPVTGGAHLANLW